MTTNYDKLLELAGPKAVKVVTSAQKAELADLHGTEAHQPVLFKVHGHIDNFETVVLTTEDYNRLYENGPGAYDLTFKTKLLSGTLLFIGFSLSDPAIRQSLESVRRIFGGSSKAHYALFPKGERDLMRMWDGLQVRGIEYNNYDELPRLLSNLAEAVPGVDSNRLGHDVALPRTTANRTIGADAPYSLVPTELRDRAIGECVVLAAFTQYGGTDAWRPGQVVLELEHPKFYQPKQAAQLHVHARMRERFAELRYVSSPRWSLRSFTYQGNRGPALGPRIRAELVPWSLVHAIQRSMGDEEDWSLDLRGQFWKSVDSLSKAGTSSRFPHHIVAHCLVVSSDKKLIVNQRANVDNQQGRISLSFEEQLSYPCIQGPRESDQCERELDGDSSPLDAVRRGAREELGIELRPDRVRFLALCMETASIAANLLAIAWADESAEEIYRAWLNAPDMCENTMLPSSEMPVWSPGSVAEFIQSGTQHEGGDRWHATSIARAVLGLVADFGVQKVSQMFPIPLLHR